MIDIPAWLKRDIGKYRCPQCQKVMNDKNINGIGIRTSTKHKTKTVFFFEYKCPCEHMAVVELNFMTVEDFVGDMVQEYTEGIEDDMMENINPTSEVAVGRGSKTLSKITDKEQEDMVKELKDCKYWDDFLIKIGFSSQQIEQHKKEGNEEYNNRKNGV